MTLDSLADEWWESLPDQQKYGLSAARIRRAAVQQSIEELKRHDIRIGRMERPSPGHLERIVAVFHQRAAELLRQERRLIDLKRDWGTGVAELMKRHPDKIEEIRHIAAQHLANRLPSRKKNHETVEENVRRSLLRLKQEIFSDFDDVADELLRRMSAFEDQTKGEAEIDSQDLLSALGDGGAASELLHWDPTELASIINRMIADEPDLNFQALVTAAVETSGRPFGIRDHNHLLAMIRAVLLVNAQRSDRAVTAAAEWANDENESERSVRSAVGRLPQISERRWPLDRRSTAFDLIRVAARIVAARPRPTGPLVCGWPIGVISACVGDRVSNTFELLHNATPLDRGRSWWENAWPPVGVQILEQTASIIRYSEPDREHIAAVIAESVLADFRRFLIRAEILGGSRRTHFDDLLAVQGFLSKDLARETWNSRARRALDHPQLGSRTPIRTNRRRAPDSVWLHKSLPEGWPDTLGLMLRKRVYTALSSDQWRGEASALQSCLHFCAWLRETADAGSGVGDSIAESLELWTRAIGLSEGQWPGPDDNRVTETAAVIKGLLGLIVAPAPHTSERIGR